MLESDEEFACPYCGEMISIRVDQTASRRQSFVTDCEICCKPIQAEVTIEADGYVDLVAKGEEEP